MKALERMLARVNPLDYSAVIISTMMTFSIAIGVLIVYHMIISAIWQSPSRVMIAIAFVAAQLLIGLPFTRLMQHMAIRTRLCLRLRHSNDDCDRDTALMEATRGNIERLFERYRLTIDRATGYRADEPSDVSWFLIITLAVVSGMWTALVEASYLLRVIVEVVLFIVGVFTYITSYHSIPLRLDERLDRVEYEILHRLTALERATGSNKYDILIRWCKRRGRTFASEIMFRVIMSHDAQLQTIVTYSTRLPQTELERISINGWISDQLRRQLTEISLTAVHGWTVTHVDDHNTVLNSPAQHIASSMGVERADDLQLIHEHTEHLVEALCSIISMQSQSIPH